MSKPKVISLFQTEQFESRFLNVPIIGRAVDVFVECLSYDIEIPVNVLKARELDIFEEAILRMIKLKKCSANDLSSILCLEKDLVKFIVIRLVENGLLKDETTISQKGIELLNYQSQLKKEVEYVYGKIFVVKQTGLVLPYIHVGEFQSEAVDDSNASTITIGFGSAGQYRTIKGKRIKCTDYEIAQKNLSANVVKKVINLFNNIASNRSLEQINLSNEYGLLNSQSGNVYFHMKAAVQEGNVDSLIISDGFVPNIDGMLDYFQKYHTDIVSDIKSKAIVMDTTAEVSDHSVIIERKFQEYERVIKELRDEISSRASMDVQSERDLYKQSCEELNVKLAELQRNYERLQVRNQDLENLEITNQVLTNKNDELQSLVQELQDSIENYKQRIERLSASEARLSDREARIAEINKGYLPVLYGAGLPNEFSEIDWLQNIYTHCNNYGITFPRRILYAFHTALKISDWSSITVLAGVSGTGKSELPKLYAAFGGMNFINVPVQPSWDSQESMLGFFNSIDNRFEPEPLLRFLVQCTENPEYSQYMSIVLLDEMNLAHVEHYFADFLSKLETRRGTSKNNVPTIEVKLGAGVEPYQLKLERSLLWTGTMNQDETTKSLSDKVLDRGLVINFPRPRTLSSRKTMAILDKLVQDSKRPMLLKKTWGSWIVRDIKLEGDQLKELEHYKKIVEDINNALEYVGRALGHRVWQSIEYYILNYPPVAEVINKKENNGEMSEALRENMKIAFEDQIVQKIMPKLRGIETRGKSKESLDKIESLLEDNGFERLKDDFDIACEQGYGQFIWSSAKYIEADEEASNAELDENQDITDDTVDSEDNSINETEYTSTTAKDDE